METQGSINLEQMQRRYRDSGYHWKPPSSMLAHREGNGTYVPFLGYIAKGKNAREGNLKTTIAAHFSVFWVSRKFVPVLTGIIAFSLSPSTDSTDGILLYADKTAGKAEQCKVKSVKLGTYILRGAVTFNDTKDNGNSDGDDFCSYSFRW